MSESQLVVCPVCASINRVPAAKIGAAPNCGRCSMPLFQGQPVGFCLSLFDIILHHVDRKTGQTQPDNQNQPENQPHCCVLSSLRPERMGIAQYANPPRPIQVLSANAAKWWLKSAQPMEFAEFGNILD